MFHFTIMLDISIFEQLFGIYLWPSYSSYVEFSIILHIRVPEYIFTKIWVNEHIYYWNIGEDILSHFLLHLLQICPIFKWL